MNPAPRITAVLSMLHEAVGSDSAARIFRDRPVLAWTLERVSRAGSVKSMAILCWDDQLESVPAIAKEKGVHVAGQGQRIAVPQLDAVSAARRWADGWRGGLLGTCEFDRGFYAPCLAALANAVPSDAFLLVDPSAGLVDPKLLDALAAHAAKGPVELAFFFSPAAPGLSGVLLLPKLLAHLAGTRGHPGRYLGYMPDSPCPDPISQPNCAPVPMRVARTGHRFTMDSQRQIARLGGATAALNGQLITAEAEQLVEHLEAHQAADALPREVVLELTTRRATRALFRAGVSLSPVPRGEGRGEGHCDDRRVSTKLPSPAPGPSPQPSPLGTGEREKNRGDLPLPLARKLFAEMAGADDVRLTLAGVGDPLLAEGFFDYLAAATEAGIRAIHVETDLLGIDDARLDALIAAPLDVISFHIPAVSGAVYTAVMGVDGCAAVLQNVRRLVERRHALGQTTPLLVPVFTKCRQNLGEMELWYDKWLKTMGSAVIAGAGDFAGQIPDQAVADMAPPKRRACARLASRITILSDGTIVACEQDVAGRHPLGRIGEDTLGEVWNKRLAPLRADHAAGRWGEHPLCAACREWHRP